MKDTLNPIYDIENVDTGETFKGKISLDHDSTEIVGSALNKANLLPDEVAERLELLGEDPQLKDAIDINPDVKTYIDDIMGDFDPSSVL